MRTSHQIKSEIDGVVAADARYNKTINEGGEGYERSSVPAALAAEYRAALAAEFAAEWTIEVLAARRAIWNAEVAALVAKHGKAIPSSAVNAFGARLGYTTKEIVSAKALHGIK